MPLSVEEIATAKKAYAEMRSCDMTSTFLIFSSSVILFFIFLFGLLFLACGVPVDDHGKFLRGWDAFLSFLSCMSRPAFFCAVPLLGQAFTYRRLKPRYAENLKLVTAMEQKHAGELPYGLEPEINAVRARPRKALLWRLDAFLSRKSASA
jgi:hypothetical protein